MPQQWKSSERPGAAAAKTRRFFLTITRNVLGDERLYVVHYEWGFVAIAVRAIDFRDNASSAQQQRL